MDTAKKEKLVEALLWCWSMSERDSRNTLVSQLPEAIQYTIKRNSIDRIDIINIVDVCLRHPQGLEELRVALRICEGDTPARAKVDRLLVPAVVSSKLQQTLLATGLPVSLAIPEWPRLYRASFPQWIIPFTPAESIDEALEHLWDLPLQPDNRRPIFDFIERIAAHVKRMSPEVTQVLRAYIDYIAPQLDPDVQTRDIMHMRTKIETEVMSDQHSRLYSLLIKIVPLIVTADPQHAEQQRYQIRFALWRAKDDITPLEPNDPNMSHSDTWHPLSRIPALLDQVLDQLLFAHIILSPEINLVVEFFLPNVLLLHAVDQYLVRFDEQNHIKLGCRYHVVVRSLERACDPRRRGYWYSKWQQLQRQLNESGMDNAVHICDCKPARWEELYFTLTKEEGTITCVGLTFVPTDASTDIHLLSAIVGAGIPIALWPRLPSRSMQQTITNLVSPANMSKLLVALREQRREAYNDADHSGNHLTLLWDNPERVFPEDDPALNNRLQLYAP